MATKIYANARFGLREDTLENWTANNPVLERGEPAAVRDGSETEWLKIGDGVTPFNDLPWKKGPKGDKGETGEQGVKGEKGDKGEKGEDADLTYINNTFAGSLKGTATGEVIRLDDVSPVEHEVNVTLESVNLAVPNGFVVENNGMTATTNPDGTITVTGSVADGTKATLLQLIYRKHEANFIALELGQIYKLVVKKDGTSILTFGTKTVYTDTGEVYWGTVETTDITRPRKVQLVYLQKNVAEGDTSLCGTYTVQLVKGTKVGEYTPYVNIENVTLTVNGNTYSPAPDGTVKGVTALSPNMTFTTDTAGVTINCEYNRDINAAFAELQQAIISLGGNV